MGDMGDFYRDWDRHKKERKRQRLATADPTGWTQHTKYHWSRTLLGDRIDYWPSTGKFRWRGKSYHGGVAGFIRNREGESNAKT